MSLIIIKEEQKMILYVFGLRDLRWQINTYIDIQLKGDGFSPKLLKEKTDLLWTLLLTAETFLKKKIQREKSPFGIGIISLEFNIENLMSLNNKLVALKKDLDDNNVDEIIFDLEAAPNELKSLIYHQN